MVRKLTVVVLIALVIGCVPAQYTVLQDSNPAANLQATKSIFVGWLPLNERRFAEHHYKSAAEFAQVIATMNREMQKGMARDMPKKRFIFARSPTDMLPPNVDLAVLFQDAVAENTSGGFNGHNHTTVRATVRFLDGKTQQEIRSTQVAGSTRGVKSFALYNLEGCLEQCAYNVGVFVTQSLANAK
jgi:hypothetical protein